MRLQLTLQFAAGLGLLFGFAHLSVGRYVEPPAEAQAIKAAVAEASAAASDGALAWHRMSALGRRTVRSIAQTPLLAGDGAAEPDAERRRRAAKAVLDSALIQSGQKGVALLVDRDGRPIAASEGSEGVADQLARSAVVRGALDGVDSVRCERIGALRHLLAGAPVSPSNDPSDPPVAAVILAFPIDVQRLNGWIGGHPMGTALAVIAEGEVVASTLGKRASSLAGSAPLEKVEIDGSRYRVIAREVSDDSGVPLAVIGLGREDPTFIDAVSARARFMISMLGAIAILLGLWVAMSAQARRPEIVKADADRGLEGLDDSFLARPLVSDAPRVGAAAGLAFNESSVRLTPPVPSPVSALSANAAPGGGTEDRKGGAPSPPEGKDVGSPGMDAPRDVAPDSAEGPSSESSSSLFEAIAAAAMTSEPPGSNPRGVRRAEPSTDPFGVDALEVDANEDLPMPVEHLQHPELKDALRSPAGGPPISAPERLARRLALGSQPGNEPVTLPYVSPAQLQTLHAEAKRDDGANPSGAKSSHAAGAVSPGPAFALGRDHGREEAARGGEGGPRAEGIGEAPPEWPPPFQSGSGLHRAPEPTSPWAGSLARGGGPAPTDDPWKNPSVAGMTAKYAPTAYDASDLVLPQPAASASASPGASVAPLPAPGGTTAKASARDPDPQDDPWGGASAGGVLGEEKTSKLSTGMDPSPRASDEPPQGAPESDATETGRPIAFDEEHYRLVYNEFVGSKVKLGEVVDNITFEGFSSKLRSSERELIHRHKCRAVRFQVMVKDRQVSLRPQLVR